VPIAGILRIVELLDSSAVVGLNVAELAKNTRAYWALPRLDSRPAHEIAETIYPPTPSAFQKSWERLEANGGRCTDHIKATVVLLPWVGESGAKSIIRPLEQ
jgi:hypothetical protein